MINWYKSILGYQYNDDFKMSEKELLERLKENKIIPCGKSAMSTMGWDVLLDSDDESYFVKASGAYLLRLKTEEKIIPGTVVKEETLKEVKKREKATGEKVSKSEIKDIKEAIIARMKAQAFVKPSYVDGYLDVKNKKLVVNASSPKKADTFTAYLRNTLGSLDIEIMTPDYDVSAMMTGWLSGDTMDNKIEMGYECKLKDFADGKATITVKDQELNVDEIKEAISAGKSVDSMSLTWQKRLNFKLTQDFKISGIKTLDIVKESVQDDLGESTDEYAKVQANMFMMVEDYNELLEDLIALG